MKSKGKDVLYYCRRCNKDFNVAGFIAKELIMFNKKAFCPECNKDDVTQRFGAPDKPKGSLDDPPSKEQLDYVKGLGGNPRNIKTKGEVGEIINQLKKEKGLM